MNMRIRTSALLGLLLPVAGGAQSLDLTVNHYGVSIGDSRLVHGIRLNFRDRRMEYVDGINATIWKPYEPARGTVRGIALGLPLTGARRIEGIGVGAFGVGVDEDFTGVGVGVFGVGAGRNLRGVMIGGFGAGSGAVAAASRASRSAGSAPVPVETSRASRSAASAPAPAAT
jgi:hypothetical protein